MEVSWPWPGTSVDPCCSSHLIHLKKVEIFGWDPRGTIDSVRRGEMLFHDGRVCFQSWLTCASCHAEGRVDGLNWDLQNDGLGNPKNARSMVHAAVTPPSMSLGVRADFKEATTAGFRHILFHEPTHDEAEAVQSYIASLQPERSPLSCNGF